MNSVFRKLNQGELLLSDELNNDVEVLESGEARFKTVSANLFTSSPTNADLTLSPSGSGVVKIIKDLNANSQKITNLPAPSADNDAARKKYVDDGLALKANIANPTFTGTITGTIGTAAQPNITSLGIQSAALDMNNNKIVNLGTATLSTDAITKGAVDTALALKADLANPTFTGTINGTIGTAAQPNITSLGTQAATLNMGTNAISGVTTLTATTLTGTLSTNAQPNIRSLGIQNAALNMGTNAISGVTTLTATTVNGTIGTAAQPNITSLGTQAAALNMGTNAISGVTTLGVTTINATTLNGTIGTAAQTNITSVGTLTSLTMGGNITTASNANLTIAPNGTGVTICRTLRKVYAYLSTYPIAYFTQNVNLDLLTIAQSSDYSDFTLTSSTTFRVVNTATYLLHMGAQFLDSANERSCQFQMFDNAVATDYAVYTALPYLDAFTSYANASNAWVLTLTAGRNYTFRYFSISGGTSNLTLGNVYVERL